MTNNDYDKVPYESYPYPRTHPENLYTIGKLFGLKAVAPKECRILELGCASGGNIIPMAVKFPNSEFVGVDFSDVQIDEAKKHAEKLKLKNLSLQNISIMDVSKNFGKFDYIIVHGVFSWVPKEVQEKILQICNDNLSENGVAYVSYNALPGWNMVKSIREMMQYHTSKFESVAEKISQAKLLLQFIKDGNANSNNAYSEVIQNEINILNTGGDAYLIHDHLEKNNEPFYLHEFVEKAQSNGLQYLGDSVLASMFAGNLPKETENVLMQASNDAVRIEQYMDFVNNRRFRGTLLCHKEVVLNRNLTGASIKDFYVTPFVRSDKPHKDIDLTQNENVTFISNNGDFNFITNNHAVIAALLYLSQFNEPVAVQKILEEVKKNFGSAGNAEAIENAVLESLLRLVLAGMPLHSFPASYVGKVTDKPKVSELSRYQATYSSWITSQEASKVDLDTFSRVLCQYLDGNNDFDAIVKNMVSHVANKELSISNNGVEITDVNEIENSIRVITKDVLDKLAPSALLVA